MSLRSGTQVRWTHEWVRRTEDAIWRRTKRRHVADRRTAVPHRSGWRRMLRRNFRSVVIKSGAFYTALFIPPPHSLAGFFCTSRAYD